MAEGQRIVDRRTPKRSPALKFKNADELRKAVIARARSEWRALTGSEWSDRAARDFADPEIGPHEQQAIEVAKLLSDALGGAAAFYREHYGKAQHYSGRTTMTHSLLSLIGFHFPMLINCSTRSSDGKPTLCNLIEPQPDGWAVETRGRVVSLMADPGKYGVWRFGLPAPATNRQMAYATLILGQYPDLSLKEIRTKGMTVAEVLRRETTAVRASRSRIDRARKAWLAKQGR